MRVAGGDARRHGHGHSDGEGKGSEFVVRLPLTDQRPERDAAAPQPRPRPRLRRGAKVVVVEDNADSRELLCELLAQAGFECRTAETARPALELIDEIQPDDRDPRRRAARRWTASRWRGALRSKREHADMFLIALTGYGQAADRATAREAGFDEHLVKPVNIDGAAELARRSARWRVTGRRGCGRRCRGHGNGDLSRPAQV